MSMFCWEFFHWEWYFLKFYYPVMDILSCVLSGVKISRTIYSFIMQWLKILELPIVLDIFTLGNTQKNILVSGNHNLKEYLPWWKKFQIIRQVNNDFSGLDRINCDFVKLHTVLLDTFSFLYLAFLWYSVQIFPYSLLYLLTYLHIHILFLYKY